MPENVPDFEPVIRALAQHGVRFVLIGGLALSAHGSDYVTRDIDFGYARDRENLAAITRAFADFHPRLRGFPPELPFVWDERTLRAAANLTLETDVAPVDFLGDIAGISSFEELWLRSIELELYGIKVHVASIEDLIAMKRAANRPKDQAHVMELLALKKLTEESGAG